MIPRMSGTEQESESQGTTLCKSCGLCCSGHLFTWVRLAAVELNPSQALGLNVIRSDPRQRGFTQPCPLWQGQCTIYTSPNYPHVCGTYKCKLLKELLDENIPLPESLTVVQRVKEMIRELEALLPASPSASFRERLVTRIETLKKDGEPGKAELEFQLKAGKLLAFFEKNFGVNDFIDPPEEE
jgi:uncharacterized protein